MNRPREGWEAAAGESALTPAQHSRLELMPADYHVVGWDFAFSSPGLAGPLIEDPLDHHICRLSPHGRLLKSPSPDALEAVVRRREWLALRQDGLPEPLP
jgi:hypothetical protein